MFFSSSPFYLIAKALKFGNDICIHGLSEGEDNKTEEHVLTQSHCNYIENPAVLYVRTPRPFPTMRPFSLIADLIHCSGDDVIHELWVVLGYVGLTNTGRSFAKNQRL